MSDLQEEEQLGHMEWIEWARRFDEFSKREKIRHRVRDLLELASYEEILNALNEHLVKETLED